MSDLQSIIIELNARAESWRKPLLDKMANQGKIGIDCSKCRGTCCTQERNSMQVTLSEGIVLYFNLKEKNLITTELIEKNMETIKSARIDQEIYIKAKRLRRNYTCPLFKHQSFGCPVDMNKKPFGCLGYNATVEAELVGDSCRSEIELLETVDQQFTAEMKVFDAKLAMFFKTSEDKKSIPEAINYFYEFGL